MEQLRESEESRSEEEDFTFYVSKKLLDGLKESLANGANITNEQIKAATVLDGVDDEDTVVPIDMSVLNDYENEDDMLRKLGPSKAAELLIGAYEGFAKSQEEKEVPEEERPQPMLAREWRAILNQEEEYDPPVLTDDQVAELFGAHAVEEIAGPEADSDEDNAEGGDGKQEKEAETKESTGKEALESAPKKRKKA
eukprot:TRINITY_DN27349_c0_g4_i1.p1 TRINITY_DN27349_c0_g4~~TRINITY_DN27349_c0_g4_i1.p1  ORF type:complete len:196 (+),score=61.29 TRINITY_DN27349_c0_g4_i1:136-723(+)